MIKWKKIEAGDYEDENGRFKILKTWDRIYGNHWILYDRNYSDFRNGQYHEDTLLDCKLRAETVFNNGKKIADIVMNKISERENLGYDYLQDSDVTAIIEECERQNLYITKEDLIAMKLVESDT